LKKEQEKLPENKEKKQSGEVTRRDFLVGAGTVVVGGAISAGVLSGCGGDTTTVKQTVTTTKTVDKVSTVTVGEGTPLTVTETKTVTGTGTSVEPAYEEEKTAIHVPGGDQNETVAVESKNGKIVRIRPFHYDERCSEAEISSAMWSFDANHRTTGEVMTFKARTQSMPSYFQYSYKKRVYSPNRVLYPLQRIDWEPGGDQEKINSQNRGKSKFKRITWDEATTIVASEIKRIQDTYGETAILDKSDSCHREKKTTTGASCSSTVSGLLGQINATIGVRNSDSWEGWYYGAMHVWGGGGIGMQAQVSDLVFDFSENAEMIVYQGCDLDTTYAKQGGWPSRVQRWYHHLGIKQVYIAPEMNWQNASNPDKWIPIIPGRDDALFLAIIYTCLNEGTWDEEYVNTHAIGMDYVRAYVLGESDDMTPKTPAWASSRCGIPEWTIKALARQWAKKKTSTQHGQGGGMIRGPFTHECTRMEVILLGMQGLGKPGINQNSVEGAPSVTARLNFRPAGPRGRFGKFSGAAAGVYPIPATQIISRLVLAGGILDGTAYTWGNTARNSPAEDQFIKYTYPVSEEEGGARIRLIWQDHACQTACWNDSNMYITALRDPSIECHIIQQMWMENDCLFADIILPVTTSMEEEDVNNSGGEQTLAIYYKSTAEPVGESKTDYEIVRLVAEKLESYGGRYEGVLEGFTGGQSAEEWIEYGFELAKIAEVGGVTLDEFKEKGCVLAPIDTGWGEGSRGLYDFYTDPVKNPLPTDSGLLEFYSQALADNFPDDDERGPYPKYLAGGPSSTHDESLVTEDGAERCKIYPLLVESNHPRWRTHCQYDDVPWLREIPTCKVKGYDGYLYEPVWMNPVDAEARGIKHGDIVKVYNERGIELGGAYVTERMVAGAVHMDHGAHVDMINCNPDDYEDRANKWINRGGTGNNISPYIGLSKNVAGMCVTSYLVEVSKVTGDEMQGWRDSYPEAFERDYDPAYGLLFNAWIEEDK
jgi:trimethylamine-N-oxide reductase (cytochrome c)